MKTISTIAALILITACTPLTAIDEITIDNKINENEFCCKYQRQGQTIAECVTVNGDCNFCYELCKTYPVKRRNPVKGQY